MQPLIALRPHHFRWARSTDSGNMILGEAARDPGSRIEGTTDVAFVSLISQKADRRRSAEQILDRTDQALNAVLEPIFQEVSRTKS